MNHFKSSLKETAGFYGEALPYHPEASFMFSAFFRLC